MGNQSRERAQDKSNLSSHVEAKVDGVQNQVYGQATHAPRHPCPPHVSDLDELPPCVEGHVVSDKTCIEPPMERTPIKAVELFRVTFEPKDNVRHTE